MVDHVHSLLCFGEDYSSIREGKMRRLVRHACYPGDSWLLLA
jgi:hypothetical protein